MSLRSPKELQRLSLCRISPPPRRIHSGPRAAPGPLLGRYTTHTRSVLDPPNCGTKDPAAAGELLGGKDWCSRYIPGPVGCHAADTPAAPAARARHATPVVATPARRRGCTRDPPQWARARDSPAPVSWTWLRLPPRLGGCRGCVRRKVRTSRAGGSRLAKSARGTGSVAHPPGVQVSQRPRERVIGVPGGGEYATPPRPSPPARRRQPLAAERPGHKDRVPAADASFSQA